MKTAYLDTFSGLSGDMMVGALLDCGADFDEFTAAMRALSIEGTSHGHWAVLDFNDVVVHVFFEDTREFYRLERNWLDATEVPLPEPYRSQARDLRLRAMG